MRYHHQCVVLMKLVPVTGHFVDYPNKVAEDKCGL